MSRSRAKRNELLATFAKTARSLRGSAGLAMMLMVVLIAVIGPMMPGRSATDIVTAPFAPPSGAAPLGGDVLGRDALARVLSGGLTLLVMALLATLLAVAVGTALGVSAAFFGGIVDTIVMRAGDVFLAFPQLVLALLLVSVLGPHAWLIVLAIVVAYAPQVARVLRSAALDVCERDFVRSAEALGTPRRKIIISEVMPNLAAPLMVELGLRLTYSIIFIAALSFLGLGQQPPAPDWGVMINENRLGLQVNLWPVLVPAALIALLTVGANVFTDAFARATLRVTPSGTTPETLHLSDPVDAVRDPAHA